MEDSLKIKLQRDCRAMLIPSGTKVTLAAGNEVQITHRLGGNFTVRGIFGIARIDGADAAALGVAKGPFPAEDSANGACKREWKFDGPKQTQSELSNEQLWEVARTVYDPEIPVNIVDLGLVYRMEIKRDNDGKNRVEVDMTLTAPGCALGPVIADDLKMRLEALPSVYEAVVAIVWDPPWNQDMMSEEARMILGLA